jgi:hypothetical protein
MSLDPKQAALTVVNEALRALDYLPNMDEESEAQLDEARDALSAARCSLTEREWPELPIPQFDAAAYQAWLAARTAEQIADGRQ